MAQLFFHFFTFFFLIRQVGIQLQLLNLYSGDKLFELWPNCRQFRLRCFVISFSLRTNTVTIASQQMYKYGLRAVLDCSPFTVIFVVH